MVLSKSQPASIPTGTKQKGGEDSRQWLLVFLKSIFIHSTHRWVPTLCEVWTITYVWKEKWNSTGYSCPTPDFLVTVKNLNYLDIFWSFLLAYLEWEPKFQTISYVIKCKISSEGNYFQAHLGLNQSIDQVILYMYTLMLKKDNFQKVLCQNTSNYEQSLSPDTGFGIILFLLILHVSGLYVMWHVLLW